MATLNEVLLGGSSAFRRANQALIGQVQAGAGPKPAPARAVDAKIPRAKPKQNIRPALEQDPQTQDRGARSSAGRPHLTFILKRVQLLDGDNKWAAIKLILDAVRYAGLITNDRECDIDLAVIQHRVSSYSKEGVKLTIEYDRK